MSKVRGILKYGDLFFLSADEIKDSSGIEKDYNSGLTFLGAENIEFAAKRLSTNRNSSQIVGFNSPSPSSYPPDFFTSCVLKIDIGIGTKSAGKPICYGSTIRLIVKKSNKYIAHRDSFKNDARSSTEQLMLVSDGDTCSDFIVLPALRKRMEGDYIYHNDVIYLQDRHGRYLHFNRYEDNYFVYLDCKEKTALRVGFYLSHDEFQTNVIKGGDVVQFIHRQLNFSLSVEMKAKFSAFRHDKVYELNMTNANGGANMDSCFSYWVIESAQDFSFSDMTGKIGWDEPVRLRHLVSGEYLAISDEPSGATESKKITTKHGHDPFDKSTIFELNSLHDWKLTETKDDDFVFRGHDCVLKHSASRRYIGATDWFDRNKRLENDIEQTSIDSISSPLEESSILMSKEPHTIEKGDSSESFSQLEKSMFCDDSDGHKKVKVVPVRDISDKHSFLISYIHSENAERIRSLLLYQHVLRHHLFQLEELRGMRSKASNVDRILRVIEDHVHHTIDTFEGGHSEKRRGRTKLLTVSQQKMLAELGFIDITMKVAKVSTLFTDRLKGQEGAVTCGRLVKIAYDLLSMILRNSPSGAIQVSMMGGIRQVIEDFSRGLGAPALELIKALPIYHSEGSSEFRTTLSEDDVKIFLKAAYQTLNSDLYMFLAQCCRITEPLSGDSHAITCLKLLQWKICDAMFSHEGKVKPREFVVTYATEIHNNRLHIQKKVQHPSGHSQDHPAEFHLDIQNENLETSIELENLITEPAYEPDLKLFSAYLHLLASLCDSNNFDCQQVIRKVLPIDHLLLALSLETTNFELKSALIEVLRCCYINDRNTIIFTSSISNPLLEADMYTWEFTLSPPVAAEKTEEDIVSYDEECKKIFGIHPNDLYRDSSGLHEYSDFSVVQNHCKENIELSNTFGLQLNMPDLSDKTSMLKYIQEFDQRKRKLQLQRSQLQRIDRSNKLKTLVNDFLSFELNAYLDPKIIPNTNMNDKKLVRKSIQSKSNSDGMKTNKEELTTRTTYSSPENSEGSVVRYARSMLLLVDSVLHRGFYGDYQDTKTGKDVDTSLPNIENDDVFQIFASCMKILKCTKSPREMPSSVGQEVWDNYFDKLYGVDHHHIKGVTEDSTLKLQACEVGTTCIEILKERVIQRLWQYFPYIIEKVKELMDTPQYRRGEKVFSSLFHKSIKYLIHNKKIDNDNILKMLWSSGFDCIRKETVGLLEQLYFDSDLLRAKILQIIQSAYTIRSSICDLMCKGFHRISASHLSDDPFVISEYKKKLTIYLIHFPNNVITASRSFKNKSFLSTLQQIINIFRGLEGDDSNGHLGLIPFCQIVNQSMKPNTNLLDPAASTEPGKRLDFSKVQDIERNGVILKSLKHFQISSVIMSFLKRSLEGIAPPLYYRFHMMQLEVFHLCFEFLLEYSKCGMTCVSELLDDDFMRFLIFHRHFRLNESSVSVVFNLLMFLIQNNSMPSYRFMSIANIQTFIYDIHESTIAQNFVKMSSVLALLTSIVSKSDSPDLPKCILEQIKDLFQRVDKKGTTQKTLLCLNSDGIADVNYVCQLYQDISRRITGAKELKHIMLQPLLTRNDFNYFEDHMKTWATLPDDTILGCHLQFIRLIALCLESIDGNDQLTLLKAIIPIKRNDSLGLSMPADFFFKIIFVDKIEIRDVFVRLLNVLLFSSTGKDEKSEFSWDLYSSHSSEILSLLKIMFLDLRQFHLAVDKSLHKSVPGLPYLSILQSYLTKTVIPFLCDYLHSSFPVSSEGFHSNELYTNLSSHIVFENTFDRTGSSKSLFDNPLLNEGIMKILLSILNELLSELDKGVDGVISLPEFRNGYSELLRSYIDRRAHPIREDAHESSVLPEHARNFLITDLMTRNIKQALEITTLSMFQSFQLDVDDIKESEKTPRQQENAIKSLESMEYFDLLDYIKSSVLPQFLAGFINYFDRFHRSSSFIPDLHIGDIFSDTENGIHLHSKRTFFDLDDILDHRKDPDYEFLCSNIKDLVYKSISYLSKDKFSELFDESVVEKYFFAQEYENSNPDTSSHPQPNGLLWGQKIIPKVVDANLVLFEQKKRWSMNGGLLLKTLLCVLRDNLDEISDGTGPYWIRVLQDGALFQDKKWLNASNSGIKWSKETRLMAQRREVKRLQFVQFVFLSEYNAGALVIHWISRTGDSFQNFKRATSLRKNIHLAISFGVSLLETGNNDVQDLLMDQAIQEFQELSESQKSKSKFFTSLKFILKYYKVNLKDSYNESSGAYDQSFADEICTLLRFLQLLCEGDNRRSKSLLRKQDGFQSVNLVSEVGSLVRQLGDLILNSIAYIEDEDFNQKYAPMVHDKRSKLISWFTRGPGDQLPCDLRKTMNMKSMQYYSQIFRAGLDCLNEFCLGPFFESQLDVAHSGACFALDDLFEFLGALQLVRHIELQDNYKHHYPFRNHSFEQHKNITTTMIHHQSGNIYEKRKERWIGSDPACIEWLYCRACSLVPIETMPNSVEVNNLFWSQKENNKVLRRLDSYANTPIDMSIIGKIVDQKQNYIEYMTKQKDLPELDDVEDEHKHYIDVMTRSKINGNKRGILSLFTDSKISDAQDLEIQRNIYIDIKYFEKEMIDLEQSCIAFVLTLLEGSDLEDRQDVTGKILDDVGVDSILHNMFNYWERFIKIEKEKEKILFSKETAEYTEDNYYERDLAFQYYSLVMRLGEFPMKAPFKRNLDEWTKTFQFRVNQHIARIEINGPMAGDLVVVYFPKPYAVKKFWQQTEVTQARLDILFPPNDSQRSSADEKVRSFMAATEQITTILRHHEYLASLSNKRLIWPVFWPVVMLALRYEWWSYLTFSCSLAINVYVLYHAVVDPQGSIVLRPIGSTLERVAGASGNYKYPPDGPAFGIIKAIHLALSVMTVFSFLSVWGWIYVSSGVKKNPSFLISRPESRIVRALLTPFYALGLLVENERIGDESPAKHHYAPLGFARPTLFKIYFLLREPITTYLMIVLAFSLTGYLYSPVLYSFCLIQIIPMNTLMRYVISSFTANFKQVLVTIILAALIIYFFVSWNFLSPNIRNEYDFEGHMSCDSLDSCYRVHLDYGWSNSPNWDNYANGYIKEANGSVYNFLYQFIINLVFPAVISGIIIDTFASQRAMKESIEADVRDRCFICNIDREDFEQEGIDFGKHIENDHNMWKYLWFQIHLSEKDPIRYNGIETFCAHQIEGKRHTRWLPVKKARCLRTTRVKYDLYSLYTVVQTLHQKVDTIADVADHTANSVASITSEGQDLSTKMAQLSVNFEKLLSDEVKRMVALTNSLNTKLDNNNLKIADVRNELEQLKNSGRMK